MAVKLPIENKIYAGHGVEIYLTHKKAKKSDNAELWLEFRQSNEKKWKLYSNLAYHKTVKTCFINH